MKQIKIVHTNLCMLVDDKDYEFLSRYEWYLLKTGGLHYTRTFINGIGINAHQLIRPSETPLLTVDHKNGNGLDNQSDNLRLANISQQAQNKKRKSGSSSKFKGVSYVKRDNKWRAMIKHEGKAISLGSFRAESLAALAYNRAAKEKFGEFARLNVLEKVQ